MLLPVRYKRVLVPGTVPPDESNSPFIPDVAFAVGSQKDVTSFVLTLFEVQQAGVSVQLFRRCAAGTTAMQKDD